MAYRTWLKDVKRLQDLGSHLVSDGDSPHWEKLEDRAYERWQKLIAEPLPVDAASAKFFGSRLHDSLIIDISRTKDSVLIKVHDSLADDFALELSGLAEVPNVQQIFPVHLAFHDVVYANGLRPDKSANLRHSHWLGNFGFNFNYLSNAFISRDWCYQQEGRLQWIVELRTRFIPSISSSDELFIVIDCAKATALDLREPHLAKLFPPVVMQFWKDIVNPVDLPGSEFDYSQGPLDYVLRRLDKYDLTQNQLAQAIRDYRSKS